MIYSKVLNSYIPTKIEKFVYEIPYQKKIIKYVVKDGRNPVGRVSLSDLPNGVFVEFIENLNPKLYKNFGYMADQIEVEHCLNRGLKNFEILSVGALNSHALHYLRGKRFFSDVINKIVKSVIENTPQNEQYETKFIGPKKMYMPQKIIKQYIERIKISPLLKNFEI